MSDQNTGTATADAAATAPTGTSTAGDQAQAPKPAVAFQTQAEFDAELAKVRRATEAETRKKLERETAEKSKPAEERLADLQKQVDSLSAENASVKHLARTVTEAARLGFTSHTYLQTALGEAMAAGSDSIDYAAVAKRAIALADADGLAPKGAAAGTTEGTDNAGVITPNQTGASAGSSTELAHMSREEALRRSVTDPEWRKSVWLPHLEKLKTDARKGLKE